MTRVHDMGGRFGDGPINPGAPDDPVFEQDWHARALAVTLAAGALGQWNLDMSRHARERLAPKDYAGFSYFEKWTAALANLLVETGVLSADDLRGQGDESRPALADRALKAENVAAAFATGGPTDRPFDGVPAFAPGQRVRTLRPAANRLVDGGHTRLPAYAAGAVGAVLRCHGAHVLPDAHAHGLGEAPEPLYTVVFPAGELWAAPENPRDEVTLDLWQSYLEPA
ncbi:nitrile hydratase subunit beta [Antarcticimicrobium sediminis]|uniref:Nitrile hydratase subunit beta n=1 Tax=Antarcticimicrobium sediminis TaxID=2546227 RepID=A0A4R5EYG5_9RHOB|nr:nitrile hydratase subunit beta [Antarcticimicrobium sediminis]TDE40145.1 nitrile hydratase subunit beta [Antarcticimicrobium sediminis]